MQSAVWAIEEVEEGILFNARLHEVHAAPVGGVFFLKGLVLAIKVAKPMREGMPTAAGMIELAAEGED